MSFMIQVIGNVASIEEFIQEDVLEKTNIEVPVGAIGISNRKGLVCCVSNSESKEDFLKQLANDNAIFCICWSQRDDHRDPIEGIDEFNIDIIYKEYENRKLLVSPNNNVF